jgi:hypothetical protein
MSPEERRRERHARYNRSAKGQARNLAYESRHPERAQRVRTGFIAQDAARQREEAGHE